MMEGEHELEEAENDLSLDPQLLVMNILILMCFLKTFLTSITMMNV